MIEWLWLLLVIPYVLIAVVAFGGATAAGQYIVWRDYVWAAVWPVYWLRPLYWKVRFAVIKYEYPYNGYPMKYIFGVPPQRFDRWLLHFGEELSLRWGQWREDLRKVDEV